MKISIELPKVIVDAYVIKGMLTFCELAFIRTLVYENEVDFFIDVYSRAHNKWVPRCDVNVKNQGSPHHSSMTDPLGSPCHSSVKNLGSPLHSSNGECDDLNAITDNDNPTCNILDNNDPACHSTSASGGDKTPHCMRKWCSITRRNKILEMLIHNSDPHPYIIPNRVFEYIMMRFDFEFKKIMPVYTRVPPNYYVILYDCKLRAIDAIRDECIHAGIEPMSIINL